MSDFLLELRSEEIPARMQAGARTELAKLFRREMEAAGLALGEVTVWSTPRRLALVARDLAEATDAVTEEAKGPPVGAPDQAVDGFCRKNGVAREDLEQREVKGRATWFAVREIPGRRTADLLAAAIPAIIRDFGWPKSMRWGAASLSTESLRWVRPLSGIVAMLDGDVVECEAHGVTSGAVTLGHRFHHAGDITLGGASDYAVKLRAAHVLVDHEERAAIIREGAAKAAQDAGLSLIEDEGLVTENAGLTEWPVPLLGRFEEEFLGVPPEVIQLTARVNQKYFVCEDAGGNLANAFVCTANIEAADGGVAIVEGNRKVLAARLADARFFWDVDRKKTLAEHVKGLARITFHEKLGTVADKVERVAKLARWLVEEGIVDKVGVPAKAGTSSNEAEGGGRSQPSLGLSNENLADLAEQAARLAKADLVTEMVGEFPELQGLMGGYYAEKEGLPREVSDAIRDHYKPIGQGDDVPTAPVTVAVSLADKLDTIVGFFGIDEKPTGSKDPFALRRAALGVLRLAIENSLRFGLEDVLARSVGQYVRQKFWRDMPDSQFEDSRSWLKSFDAGKLIVFDVPNFFADRLKVQQREAGVRHDLIDAVFALGGEDDLVRLLARVHALQSFVDTEDGANLLAGYKRAANILKKEDWDEETVQVPQTGEEDPLALVDDPELRAVVDAQLEERSSQQSASTPLSYAPEPAEQALIDALDAAEPEATQAIEREEFASAMAALASLRAPIDAFFEEVTVNDDNPDKRRARLRLLARLRDSVDRVADFSRIEG